MRGGGGGTFIEKSEGVRSGSCACIAMIIDTMHSVSARPAAAPPLPPFPNTWVRGNRRGERDCRRTHSRRSRSVARRARRGTRPGLAKSRAPRRWTSQAGCGLERRAPCRACRRTSTSRDQSENVHTQAHTLAQDSGRQVPERKLQSPAGLEGKLTNWAWSRGRADSCFMMFDVSRTPR